MNRLARQIPLSLILARGIAGVVMPLISLAGASGAIIAVLVIAGVLSDVFDGIVARRVGVATPRLRRLDSIVDLLFWIGAAACLWTIRPDLMATGWWIALAILLGEAITYGISLFRYRCIHSTHAYSAKVFGVIITVCFVAAFGFGAGMWTLYVLLTAYVLSALDVLAIILLLDQPRVDVPSAYHALLIRRGKAFGTHWLFHGRHAPKAHDCDKVSSYN